SIVLSGIIWDGKHKPLSGVTVNLPELELTDTTNQFGKFRFEIKEAKSTSSSLIALKNGYDPWNDDVKLDNPKLEFTMQRKQTPPKPDLNPKESTKNSKQTIQRDSAIQVLSGIILGEGNEPLVGVTVTLADFNRTTTTDQIGKYNFQVMAKKQQTVNLIAQKAGYKPYNTYAVLGNPAHNFTMEIKP
ncbi:MAG: carboxypeptidase-like regulatory domain-containing protein, partial [Candidatus Poribacteria bacterium]